MSDDDNGNCKKPNQRQHDHDKQKSNRITMTRTTLNAMLLLLPHAASMDFSQIELRYRAEGNANLVLAMPQFRKVLRLPKMSSNTTTTSKVITTERATDHYSNIKQQQQQQQEPQQLQSTSGMLELKLQDPKGSAPHSNVLLDSANGKLYMADYVGYIDVVRRLLGHEFILTAEIIDIASEEQRYWINESIRPYRPAKRLDKEFCGHFGLLLPDATLLPEANIILNNLQATPAAPSPPCISGNIYAIEIKPKQGWLLPSPSDVNDLFHMQQQQQEQREPTIAAATCSSSASISVVKKSTTRCRYCAMQFLKLQNSKISKRSSYCPIELFSGQPLRMLAALSSLFECPQNNLRVFENGNLIYGDHATSISCSELKQNVFKGDMLQIVQHLLVTCLLRDYQTTPQQIPSIRIPTKVSSGTTVVEVVAGQPHLTAKAMVPTMKKTTEMLKTGIELDDTVVEEKVAAEVDDQEHLQKKKKPRLESTTASMTLKEVVTEAQITDAELLCLPKNCVLHKVLHLQLLAKQNLRHMSTTELANETTKNYRILRSLLATPAAEITFEQLKPTQEYLLGATAMDCSVMIAFQALETGKSACTTFLDPHIVHLTEFNKQFITQVTILDLDPKPDSHFNKYIKQTQQAYQCCAESLCREM